MLQFPQLKHPVPMTATERSRAFRRRNPGYDMLRMRRERAAIKANVAARQQPAPAKPPLLLPAPMLLLPAPAAPAFDLLAQLNAARQRQAEAEPVPALPYRDHGLQTRAT